MTKIIEWYTWQYVKCHQAKTGKTVSKRMLIKRDGTIRECLDQLINTDVLKPGKSKEFTFVKLFLPNQYSFKCISIVRIL